MTGKTALHNEDIRQLNEYDMAALQELMGLYADFDISFVQIDEIVDGFWDVCWQVTVWNKRGDATPLVVVKSRKSLAEAVREADRETTVRGNVTERGEGGSQ